MFITSTSPITYLACPYTPLPSITDIAERQAIMDSRFKLVTLLAAFLISKGYVIFSPLTHSHVIQANPLNTFTKNDHETWVYGQDVHFVRASKQVLIVDYEQWEPDILISSNGVAAEKHEAALYDIPIKYLRVQFGFDAEAERDFLALGISDKGIFSPFMGSIILPQNTPPFL